MGMAEGLVHRGVHRLQRDAAAALDGVPGIHDEVGEDLVHLGGVDPRRPEGGRRLPDQRDVLPDEAPEHALGVLDQLVEVHLPGLDDLLAGEGQELADEVAGAHRGLPDLVQVLHALGILRQPLLEQVRIADDDAEHVVRVVGHASRQLTQGVQLLGLAQHGLQAFALRDVPDHDDDDVPVVPPGRLQGGFHVEGASIRGPARRQLQEQVALGPQLLVDGPLLPPEALLVALVEGVVEGREPLEVLPRHPVHGQGGIVDLQDPACRLVDEDRVGSGIEQGPKARLGLLEPGKLLLEFRVEALAGGLLAQPDDPVPHPVPVGGRAHHKASA